MYLTERRGALLKRVRKAEGDLFKVPVGNAHSYAVALQHPLFGFFNVLTEDELDPTDIDRISLLFKVWVMDYAVKKAIWTKVGHTDKFIGRFKDVRFFKQDILNGCLTSYGDSDGTEFPIDFDTASQMEPAAVWDPEHIEDRLLDHFAGRPNKWVESMRPKKR